MLENQLDTDTPLIQFVATTGDDPEAEEDLVKEWEVKNVTPNQIDIQLLFADPLTVSQGDEPDYFTMLLNFGNFETNSGNSLPINTIINAYIPRQLDPYSE